MPDYLSKVYQLQKLDGLMGDSEADTIKFQSRVTSDLSSNYGRVNLDREIIGDSYSPDEGSTIMNGRVGNVRVLMEANHEKEEVYLITEEDESDESDLGELDKIFSEFIEKWNSTYIASRY
ncbi:MAG: hypothetical protein ABEJ56_05445 [Candidatus Nanohaloarchaea archaeon]